MASRIVRANRMTARVGWIQGSKRSPCPRTNQDDCFRDSVPIAERASGPPPGRFLLKVQPYRFRPLFTSPLPPPQNNVFPPPSISPPSIFPFLEPPLRSNTHGRRSRHHRLVATEPLATLRQGKLTAAFPLQNTSFAAQQMLWTTRWAVDPLPISEPEGAPDLLCVKTLRSLPQASSKSPK